MNAIPDAAALTAVAAAEPSATLTPERKQFLTDLFTGAIENGGAGAFVVHHYEWDCPAPYAILEFEDEPRVRYDLDAVERGLHVIGSAVLQPDVEYPEDVVLHNAETGVRLYMSTARQAAVVLADKTNGEDDSVDLDVIEYLAILECALLGSVVYG